MDKRHKDQPTLSDLALAEHVLVGALLEGVREAHEAFDDVAAAIASLDRRIARQLDLILHHPTLQALEARWRGLHWLSTVATEDRRVRVQMLSISQEDLLMDFEDAPRIERAGLYSLLHTGEFGSFGGTPFGLVMADFTFGPSPQDMGLLSECFTTAAAAHAPFVATVDPVLVGAEPVHELGDAGVIGEQQQLEVHEAARVRWQALRQKPEARHCALVLGRVLLRMPYTADDDGHDERIDCPEDLLWGSAMLAVGIRLAASFEETGWGLRLPGAVPFAPELQDITPLEAVLADEQRAALAHLGIMTLKPSTEGEGALVAETPCLLDPSTANDPRNAELPSLLVATRIGQMIKVLHRENIGCWKDRFSVSTGLQRWLSDYVVGARQPGGFAIGWRPFYEAHIEVQDTGPRGYRFELALKPNWAERGGPLTITLEGKLQKD